MRRASWLAGVILLIAVRAAGAQTSKSPATTPPPQSPGPALAPARPVPALVTPYHHRFRMVMSRGGRDQDVGSLDDQVILGQHEGKPAIIRVQNVEGAAGVMTDTAVADAATLAPRWHSSASQGRTLRLDFAPRRVTGALTKSGDGPLPIDQQVPDSLYDSNMLDVVLSALPLAAGYRARMTIYLYEAGGPTPVDVEVTGSEKVDGVDTWITGVTIGGRTARYYVGKTTHQVARIVSTPGPGMEIRIVPRD